MLPKAVRLAMSVVRRPDVDGDREEAYATAVAALWQVVATCPITRRPRRVTANPALDTLAVVQRGHTGSSHTVRSFPERPCADLRQVCEPVHYDPDPDELAVPSAAELLMLLARGVCAPGCWSWPRRGCWPAPTPWTASRPAAAPRSRRSTG
jgi:hypothetical protein